jgi:hypothetical protein
MKQENVMGMQWNTSVMPLAVLPYIRVEKHCTI